MESQKERDHQEDLDLGLEENIKMILRLGCVGMDCDSVLGIATG
jgi:hypothetical protein